MRVEKLTLNVPTIKCEGCIENIGRALKKRKGVAQVEGNPETKEVVVSFVQEEIGEDEIRGVVVQIGHQLG